MPATRELINDISTFLWGALTFLAIFIVCFLSWKVVNWLRNAKKSEGRPVNGGHRISARPDMEPREPTGSWDQAISRPSDCMYGSYPYGSGFGDLGGMSRREQEEFFSIYGPRNVRKAMKESRKSRQQPARNVLRSSPVHPGPAADTSATSAHE
jgi:hypothetical protein